MIFNRPAIYYVLIAVTTIFLISALTYQPAQQSADQALAWVNGRLDVNGVITFNDTVVYKDKIYWTLGPFPSVLLLPIVIFTRYIDHWYSQNILYLFLIPLVFYIAYLLAKKIGFSREDSLYLTLAFCLGSVFCQVVLNPSSWMLAHAVSVALTLLALLEHFSKNRPQVIGILMAFLLATRPTAFLAIAYFILAILYSKDLIKYKISRVFLLLVPCVIASILLMYFNYLRFENIFETGYQSLANNRYFPELEASFDRVDSRKLFSISHIPRNFSIYFLTLIKPGVWGLDVNAFIACLPFLYVLFANKKHPTVQLMAPVIALILFSLLAYYWAGWNQIGPRYLTDLLPLLYVVLLYSFKDYKLSTLFKRVVLASIALNLSIYFWYYANVATIYSTQ